MPQKNLSFDPFQRLHTNPMPYPDAPCMEYLPTFGINFHGFHVGKYTSPMEHKWVSVRTCDHPTRTILAGLP